MSVDKPAEIEDMKDDSGGRSEHVNGVQNGYLSSDKHKSSHKSSSKDKHRDKDRDHKSSSSKHGSSTSSRDKDKHSSSKSSSSHKSSSRDKERSDKDRNDRDKNDKDRSDRDKSKSDKDRKSSDKPKSSDSSRDKERSDKHKSSSSSTNDKDKKHSSSKDKSSSSSSRDKSSSSKDKDRSDKSRSDKDKHRSDKDKHSSSSKDKDKRSSNESSRDKDKTSSKDKSSHSSSRDKHNSHEKTSSKSPEKKEEIKLKIEQEEVDIYDSDIAKRDVKIEQYDDAVDPLANVTASSCDYSLSQFKDEPLNDQMDVDSEEDIPLLARKKRKSYESESEEEKPLAARKKPKTEKKKKIKQEPDYDDEYSEDEPPPKKTKAKAKVKTETKPQKSVNTSNSVSPKKKKKEDEPEVWKWWEEEKKDDGTKWKYLEHKGPLFAPPYDRLPKNVIFKYDGKEISLSEEAEEVAGFYAKMLDHDYTTKSAFNDNFFGDWRRVMNDKEKSTIKNLSKCDFKSMHAFFKDQSEKNKNKSKEEKLALKNKNEEIQKEYGFCTIDGHKEKIGNFRIEPPGLFRGRGEHPKMGKLKQRVVPEHVIINCSKDSKVPKPPDGHKWKEVRHDNSVTWLASWTENVQGQVKYVMLNPSSKLKGEKDWQKYETARKLAKSIDKIRNTYREEWKAKEMRIRQRAVALYFIDRLALRAGNEKDEDQADTVGCCSLRVEHIELHKQKDGREFVVVFDFLGKDSIRYYNEVPVEKRVFKNLEIFKENKKEGDDLFDRLNTQTMNEHLRELMPNLTAKVFRTFNASFTLQNQLNELTDPDSSIEEKILAYNRANRAVAVLCNHQRAVPKGHQKSMDALKDKIQLKRNQIDEAEADMRDAVKQAKKGSVKEKLNADKKKKALERLRDQLRKLEVQETDRDENKTIALGTSKLNYLDPRISIAWCKKNGVPMEKIYNKTQRDKFRWAIDMATEDYVF